MVSAMKLELISVLKAGKFAGEKLEPADRTFLRRWAENIHSGIEGAMISIREFKVGRKDRLGCSSCVDHRQFVFESLWPVEVSFGKVGQDPFLNVIQIEDNYNPIHWIFVVSRLRVGP